MYVVVELGGFVTGGGVVTGVYPICSGSSPVNGGIHATGYAFPLPTGACGSVAE
jgi:hypothetical protein